RDDDLMQVGRALPVEIGRSPGHPRDAQRDRRQVRPHACGPGADADCDEGAGDCGNGTRALRALDGEAGHGSTLRATQPRANRQDYSDWDGALLTLRASPSRAASAPASARVRTASLRSTAETWRSTVRFDR